MNKNASVALVFGLVLVIGAAWYALRSPGSASNNAPDSVSVENGIQTVEILARGGYSPRQITAKAGLPTILKVRTQNTFDCSAALVIPQLGYRKMLSPAGIEEINISADQAQGTLRGVCGMGMYSFTIDFQ